MEGLVDELLSEGKIKKYKKSFKSRECYLGVPGGYLSQLIIDPTWYDPALEEGLCEAIYHYEQQGHPFNKKGTSAIYKRIPDLPETHHLLTKDQFTAMVNTVIKSGKVVVYLMGMKKILNGYAILKAP